MAKAVAKTVENTDSVADFIQALPDEAKRADAFALLEIIRKVSGLEPKMWGSAIIGFGSYHYKYESGHEGDASIIGFSPRKAAFSLYLPETFDKKEALLMDFGKHKTGKGCIYFKQLKDIKVNVLESMLANALKKRLSK